MRSTRKCECGGTAERILTTTDLKINGKTVVVNNVPAFKCRDCGEIFFSLLELGKLERKLQKESVPFYT